jgi:uncharacterized protein
MSKLELVQNEFLCVRCSRHMKTCCQTSEVYTTLGDVERISKHSGKNGFTEFRAPTNPNYSDQDDDPIWNKGVFRTNGERRILKRKPNGDCTFLGNAGCELPLEIRPLICRIYPYDYTAYGLREELAPGCPTELLAEGQGLLEALQIPREDAVRWHAQLYHEIQLEIDAGVNQ